MFPRLLLLFTLVPLLELALLIEVGAAIGAINTIAIVLVTGIAGAALARHQGFQVFNAIQRDIAQGVMPADSLLEGLLLFAGALLLVTPGLLTDIIGFTLLLPVSRRLVKGKVKSYLQRKLESDELHVNYEVKS